jgi:hypothetical protein
MALHMVTSYMPQVALMNDELPPKSSLDLTLTQHPCDEKLELRKCALVLKLNSLEPSTIVFLRTFTPW